MRNLYVHIHGTTSLSSASWVAKLDKRLASAVHPALFTNRTNLRLIPLHQAPQACQNFKELYKKVSAEDRFYFQWPGNLGQHVWQVSADFIADEIERMIGDKPANVIIVGHSHGGNIARLAADMFLSNDSVAFHVMTVATPLSLSPPLLMPGNVKTWLHFYHNKDMVAHLGSAAMQGFSGPITRRIEDVVEASANRVAVRRHACTWQSHELKNRWADPHNDVMGTEGARVICENSHFILAGNLRRDCNDEQGSMGEYQSLAVLTDGVARGELHERLSRVVEAYDSRGDIRRGGRRAPGGLFGVGRYSVNENRTSQLKFLTFMSVLNDVGEESVTELCLGALLLVRDEVMREARSNNSQLLKHINNAIEGALQSPSITAALDEGKLKRGAITHALQVCDGGLGVEADIVAKMRDWQEELFVSSMLVYQ